MGYRLIDWRGLRKTYAASPAEALIFVATAVAILATDFVTGVGIGILVAVIDFARRSSRLDVAARPALLPAQVAGAAPAGAEACVVVRIEGPLFFGSHAGIDQVLAGTDGAAAVVVDLSGVRHADLTGAQSLARVVGRIVKRGAQVWLFGARPAIRPVLDVAGLAGRLVADEAEALRPPASVPSPAPSARPRPETAKPRGAPASRPGLPPSLQPSLE